MGDSGRGGTSTFVHSFLSVYVPFLFLYVSFVVLIGGAFAVYDIQVFPRFYFVVLLLAGVSESAVGNVLTEERNQSIVPRLRELALVLIVSFGLILLLYGDLIGGEINLARANIWISLLIVLVQWLLSLRVHRRLRSREFFLNFFEGKERRTFKDVYAAHNHEGGEAIKALQSVRRLLFAFLVIEYLLLITMTWGADLGLTAMGTTLVLVLFGSFLIIAAGLNRYIETQRVMAEGHVVGAEQARRKTAAMVLLFAFVGLLAFTVSGGRAMLPTSYLESTIDWLLELDWRDRSAGEVKPPEFRSDSTDDQLPEFVIPAQRAIGRRDDDAGLGPIVGVIVVGVLVLGFLAFLIAPLVRLHREGRSITGALRERLVRFLAGLRTGWRSLIRSLKRMIRQSRKVGTVAKRIGEELRSAAETRRRSTAKRQSLGGVDARTHSRVLKSFMRFVKWAGKHDVTFRTSIGPREFAATVAREVPDQTDDVMEIAELFEEIVFSHHQIDNSQTQRYHQKIAKVTQSR
jgi:hypothetical protein